MYCLCVIPARGGSKGLPGKNLREVGGKSLVRRAVEAALASQRCSRVLCSTDDEAIAAEAIRAGADVPLRRPAALAGDATPTVDVVLHAMGHVEGELGRHVDLVCLLQPTSPLRTAGDVRATVDALLAAEGPADSAVSLVEVGDAHPRWLRKIERGYAVPYFEEPGPEPTRRQDLAGDPVPYRRNGAVYVARREVLVSQRRVFGDRCVAYVMPPERSIDIDTEYDLVCAQALWRHLLEKGEPVE